MGQHQSKIVFQGFTLNFKVISTEFDILILKILLVFTFFIIMILNVLYCMQNFITDKMICRQK